MDELLIVQFLLRHAELDIPTAAQLCQRPEQDVREILSALETGRGLVLRGGTKRSMYYSLRPEARRAMRGLSAVTVEDRIDWEAAKMRLVSVLQVRQREGKPGLTNAETRAITRYGREQVKRLMKELSQEHPVRLKGRGRFAQWRWVEDAAH